MSIWEYVKRRRSNVAQVSQMGGVDAPSRSGAAAPHQPAQRRGRRASAVRAADTKALREGAPRRRSAKALREGAPRRRFAKALREGLPQPSPAASCPHALAITGARAPRAARSRAPWGAPRSPWTTRPACCGRSPATVAAARPPTVAAARPHRAASSHGCAVAIPAIGFTWLRRRDAARQRQG